MSNLSMRLISRTSSGDAQQHQVGQHLPAQGDAIAAKRAKSSRTVKVPAQVVAQAKRNVPDLNHRLRRKAVKSMSLRV